MVKLCGCGVGEEFCCDGLCENSFIFVIGFKGLLIFLGLIVVFFVEVVSV